MPNQFDEQDSLDRAVTRTGGESRPDSVHKTGDTISSLGDQETGSDTRSSLSDLADLGEDDDVPQDVVDLSARYELGDVLGRGGMGEVISAMDRRLKRQVAIKRIRGELGASRQAMRRFLTEAISVAALNHYNVVQIHDYGHTTDGPFLVMELVEGPTLADNLREGPLPLEEAVELACQLCDGLQAAHDRGIVHRDIKPANILLTAAGTPKLTDFGLAKEAGDTGHTQAGAVLGTLDYMSPEQRADSSRADARSDQWSLAATFYQMVTGEPPRIIDTDTIPEPVRDVVRRALKSNPEERFESVREFGEALRHVVNPSGGPQLDRSMLQEGQCPGCGTVNDIARQFCRGCGAGLDETCPECGAGEKVWERFCGKCGTDIPAVLEAQIELARELPGDVQSLRSDFRHAEALEKLAPLLELSHPALAEHREWAEKTRNQLAGELAERESQRAQLLQAAREQKEQGSFSEAKKYLAQIPAALQNEECHQLAEQISTAATEAKQLATEIGTAVRTRNFDGLDVKLERYLELKPQDEKARRLLEKVRQRLHRAPPELSAGQAEKAAPSPGPPATAPENEVPARSSARTAVIATGCGLALLLMFVWRFFLAGSSSDVMQSPEPVSAASASRDEASLASAIAAAPPLFDSVTAPRREAEAKAAQQAWADYLKRDVVETNSVGMELVLLPPGKFRMGSSEADIAALLAGESALKREHLADETPQITVTLTQPLFVGQTEVTQGQWTAIMGTTPWEGGDYVREGSRYPATYVSHDDAVDFCRRLSAQEGKIYRLLTEAEWEYACRAGTTTRYQFGDDADRLGDYAWFRDNTFDIREHYAHEVALKPANPFGLYDMHGNVWEWCQDWYNESEYGKYASRTAENPQGPENAEQYHSLRGSSYWSVGRDARSACRFRGRPDVRINYYGFRVAQVPTGT